MQKWEYYWEIGDEQTLEELLETKGEEGWELVSVTSVLIPEAGKASIEKDISYTAFFKRPKEKLPKPREVAL